MQAAVDVVIQLRLACGVQADELAGRDARQVFEVWVELVEVKGLVDVVEPSLGIE